MAVSKKLRFLVGLVFLFIILIAGIVQGCDEKTTTSKGANKSMETYYIGRFSIAVPIEMELKLRSSKLRNVAIKEILWPINIPSEQARIAEWDRFMAEIKK